VEWRTERGQLRLELGRHRLAHGDSHVVPQALFEVVPLGAPPAQVEMGLRLLDFRVRKRSVEVRLHQLLAPLTPLDHAADPVMQQLRLRDSSSGYACRGANAT